MLTAFQVDAFQNDAFQVDAAAEIVKPPKAETGGAVVGRAGSGRWQRVDDDTVYLRAKSTRAAARSRSSTLDLAQTLVARKAVAHAKTAPADLPIIVSLQAAACEASLHLRSPAESLTLVHVLEASACEVSFDVRTRGGRIDVNDLPEVLRIIEMLTKRAA